MMRSSCACLIPLVGVCGVVMGATPAKGGDRPLNGPASKAEIAQLIEDLSAPGYEKRTYATRRLTAIGTTAYDEVKVAAASDDPETALRADRILSIYDGLLFSNTDVSLQFSKSKIGWTDSVDLGVTIKNHGDHPAKVPFALDPSDRADRSREALQVADMLDVGDWIHVQRSDGKSVDLRVDEISLDADVVGVVQERLNGGPFATIPAGKRVTLTVHDFNRGWARYPLLEAGEYTVTFEYVPEWRDSQLAEARVGRIASPPVTLTVTSAAPETVSRNGIQADCVVAREGDSLVAYVVNRTDHIAVVNRNFGRSLPFAGGVWVFESGPAVTEIPAGAERNETWQDFRLEGLVEVGAGDRLEVARVDIKTLRQRFAESGVDITGDSGSIHFQYNNECDRLWQSRERATLAGNINLPEVLREPLPRRMLSTRQPSNRLHVMDLR